MPNVPRNLKRFYGSDDLHFITFSCYRRLKLLNTAARRELFMRSLELIRKKYRFIILGFVVMPEHVHLLLTEPEVSDLSVAIKALKQSVARKVMSGRRKKSTLRLFSDEMPKAFWQPRFYDFNVYTEKKRIEKLRYVHRNPVTRDLVDKPEDWRWSSFRQYAFNEAGPVEVNTPVDLEKYARRSRS
jgi:putative transposase